MLIPRRKTNLSFLWFYVIATFILAGTLIPVALQRLIARDEGFYLLAAQLVYSGQTVYHDFFYPQMPFLPYFYAAWFSITSWSWESARLGVTLAAVATGLITAGFCRQRLGSTWGLIAAIVFAFNNFIFPWYTTAQSYSISILLLWGGIALLLSGTKSPTYSRCLLAGLLFGAAIGTRLMLAGVGPVLCLYLYLAQKNNSGLKKAALFCVGSIIALSPIILLIIPDWHRFYFNNFGYHQLRSNLSFWDVFPKLIGNLLGLRSSIKYDAWQFPLLLYLSVIGMLIPKIRQDIKLLTLASCTIVLFLINLLPTPPYMQYFCVLIPFLIILALSTLHWWYNWIWKHSNVNQKSVGLTLLLLTTWLYLAHLDGDIDKYTRTGEGVIGIVNAKNATSWTIDRVKEIRTVIESSLPPNERVISQWPGYLFGTSAKSFPRWENQFGSIAASKLNTDDALHLQVAGRAEMLMAIRNREPAVVVLYSTRYGRNVGRTLSENHYQLIKKIPPVHIFQRIDQEEMLP